MGLIRRKVLMPLAAAGYQTLGFNCVTSPAAQRLVETLRNVFQLRTSQVGTANTGGILKFLKRRVSRMRKRMHVVKIKIDDIKI